VTGRRTREVIGEECHVNASHCFKINLCITDAVAVRRAGVGKTPDAVVRRINQEVVRVLGQPDARTKLFDTGGEAGRETPEEFGARIKADISRWARVIKEAGTSAE
jgi:tripartite-type tricarboxylate transporter receptor subunit TctC